MDANQSAPPHNDLSALSVLIIDAEESFVKSCRETLANIGCAITVAKSGQQGLEMAEADQPEVVILDLKMKEISGLKMLSELAEVAPDAVPVVATASGSVDDAVEAMKRGAFDFLTKPVAPAKLRETLLEALNVSAMQCEDENCEICGGDKADKYDLLLGGLDVLKDAYAIGLEKRQFLDELNRLENVATAHAASLGQSKSKEEAIADIHEDLLDADAIMWNYDFQKNALIQILLDVQEKFRWLPRHILNWISGRLNIPLSEIYVIANFYEAFSLEPRGRHVVQVCTGTACHVRGASELLTKISATLGIEPGQTDSKQEFTLETVHCIGCCALAPVVQIDSQYYRNPSKTQFEKIIKSLGEEAQAC